MSGNPPPDPDEPKGRPVEDDALRALLDEERGRAAAAERTRIRRLREQAAEEGTLAGTLLDLLEQGTAVTIRGDGGRAHQGIIVGVGLDYCALRSRSGQPVYLALAAIGTVRPAPGAPAGDVGSRAGAEDRTLSEVLARLAPHRPRVALRLLGDPDPVAGELGTVGQDVGEVRLDGPGRPRCYVRLGGVWEVTVDPA